MWVLQLPRPLGRITLSLLVSSSNQTTLVGVSSSGPKGDRCLMMTLCWPPSLPFPVSLPSSLLVSWNHLPHELLKPEAWSQCLFGGTQSRRASQLNLGALQSEDSGSSPSSGLHLDQVYSRAVAADTSSPKLSLAQFPSLK